MTELRDLEFELGRFRGRVLAAAAFVFLAFSLLAARLVHLQIFRHDELATQAEANRIAVVPIVPNRGLIVDRNGVVLATNYSAYTLEIAPQRGKSAAAIHANTALLRDGYLDSFALVELIAELEKQLNISLPDGSLIPEDFETPEVLFNRLQEL